MSVSFSLNGLVSCAVSKVLGQFCQEMAKTTFQVLSSWGPRIGSVHSQVLGIHVMPPSTPKPYFRSIKTSKCSYHTLHIIYIDFTNFWIHGIMNKNLNKQVSRPPAPANRAVALLSLWLGQIGFYSCQPHRLSPARMHVFWWPGLDQAGIRMVPTTPYLLLILPRKLTTKLDDRLVFSHLSWVPAACLCKDPLWQYSRQDETVWPLGETLFCISHCMALLSSGQNCTNLQLQVADNSVQLGGSTHKQTSLLCRQSMCTCIMK